MGQSRAWTYSVRFKLASGRIATPQEWRVKASKLYGPGFGKPTVANLDRWVTANENSTRPGGPNAHLGQDQITHAFIYDQRTGALVASWVRSEQRKGQPLFEILS